MITTQQQADAATADLKKYYLRIINDAITTAGSPENLSLSLGLARTTLRSARDRGILSGYERIARRIVEAGR
ncbi:hypothetical protein LCGC14_0831680 [marine sediment metagenome]|uniref:Uncharacterized protein n=1 Tax=marine sediment metagenome TaxID=412755 RepID=A0A0F9PKD8_9ZZZZ